jgi:hypothetical protein
VFPARVSGLSPIFLPGSRKKLDREIREKHEKNIFIRSSHVVSRCFRSCFRSVPYFPVVSGLSPIFHFVEDFGTGKKTFLRKILLLKENCFLKQEMSCLDKKFVPGTRKMSSKTRKLLSVARKRGQVGNNRYASSRSSL